jgi:predicted HAD superfamily Cof-like phosphohydrolase
MFKELEFVKDFHTAYKQFIGKSPEIPKREISSLRNRLIVEECIEVQEELTSKTPDINKIAKELADLCYVVYGTIISYGLQDKFEEIFQEVHNSNMSKLDENGKVIYREDGKILKSSLYKEADINKILNG